jgi:hypothetical protein
MAEEKKKKSKWETIGPIAAMAAGVVAEALLAGMVVASVPEAAGIKAMGVAGPIAAGQSGVPATWSVENQSYQGSTSNEVPYTFVVSWAVTLADGTMLAQGSWNVDFPAGTTIMFGGTSGPYPATFNVPATAGGKSGSLTVVLSAPANPSVAIKQNSQGFNVAASPAQPTLILNTSWNVSTWDVSYQNTSGAAVFSGAVVPPTTIALTSPSPTVEFSVWLTLATGQIMIMTYKPVAGFQWQNANYTMLLAVPAYNIAGGEIVDVNGKVVATYVS